jgi:hypothetical protein
MLTPKFLREYSKSMEKHSQIEFRIDTSLLYNCACDIILEQNEINHELINNYSKAGFLVIMEPSREGQVWYKIRLKNQG